MSLKQACIFLKGGGKRVGKYLFSSTSTVLSLIFFFLSLSYLIFLIIYSVSLLCSAIINMNVLGLFVVVVCLFFARTGVALIVPYDFTHM